jgi:AraC-like DNA-binding protein
VISGILHILKTGGCWRDVPPEYGPAKTIYNRYTRWARRGVWQRIFAKVAAAGSIPEELALDSSNVKAHRVSPTESEPFRRHFRAPVRFSQEVATPVFGSRDLDRKVVGAEPLLCAVLEERINGMRGHSDSAFADDIQRRLRAQLTSNRCTAEDISQLLEMHRRTLNRRLKKRDLDYRTICDEVRFEIARQLLKDTQIPLVEIAATLGYSEASAFSRAFRRWSGRSPLAWRTAQPS